MSRTFYAKVTTVREALNFGFKQFEPDSRAVVSEYTEDTLGYPIDVRPRERGRAVGSTM